MTARRASVACALGAGALLAACGGDAAALPRELAVRGLDRPVAALHDAELDVYLVACRSPAGPSQGCIARVHPDGTLGDELVDGATAGVELNAPCQMALDGDRLLVADLTVVRAFDRRTGAPLGVIEGTQRFVHGLAVAPDGAVWFGEAGGEGTLPCVRRVAVGADDLQVPLPDRRAPTVPGDALVALATGVYQIDGSGVFLQIDPAGRLTELIELGEPCVGLVRPGPGQWWTIGQHSHRLLVLDVQGGVRRHPDLDLDDAGLFDVDRGRQRLLVPRPRAGELLLRAL